MYYLGVAYDTGKGHSRRTTDKAVEWNSQIRRGE